MQHWIEVGELEQIPVLGSRVIATPEGDIALFRNSANEVFALRDRCPHRGGALSQGIVHGRQVTCPLHNWVLELESGEAVAPDRGCAKPYPVKVQSGRILLSLDIAAVSAA